MSAVPQFVFSDFDYICNPVPVPVPAPLPISPALSDRYLDIERCSGSAASATPSRARCPSPCDTLDSETVVDSDSDYDMYSTDSSEEPDYDPEEDALLAQGFVVYE